MCVPYRAAVFAIILSHSIHKLWYQSLSLHEENHIANIFFLYGHGHFKQPSYQKKGIYLLSLSNLRCLFTSDRHKSVYIDNRSITELSDEMSRRSWFKNLIFRHQFEFRDQFNPTCDICWNWSHWRINSIESIFTFKIYRCRTTLRNEEET